MSDFCKVENEFIVTHDNYSPKNAVYGFLGKKTPLKSHKFLLHLDNNAVENRSGIKDVFGEKYSDISVLKQVHSDRVVEICDVPALGNEYEADAQVTKRKDILLGIQTADCVPVLFIDQENEVIGAAHAGWRGALEGVISRTIERMQNIGANLSCVEAVIGPCIRQKSYEVGSEFLECFLEKDKASKKFFIPGEKGGKFMFDLPGYVKDQLASMNLKSIFDVGLDTFALDQEFFSYRREKHKGSIMSVVGLK